LGVRDLRLPVTLTIFVIPREERSPQYGKAALTLFQYREGVDLHIANLAGEVGDKARECRDGIGRCLPLAASGAAPGVEDPSDASRSKTPVG